MASTYGKLLLAVYELEGLLLVLEQHGTDTPASVVELIKQKAAYVADEAQRVQFPEQTVEDEMIDAALNEGAQADDASGEPAAVPPMAEESQEEVQDDATADTEADNNPDSEGDAADTPPHFVKCPDCGKVLPAGYTFCNECGCPLGGAPKNGAVPEESAPIEDADTQFVEADAEDAPFAPEPTFSADDDDEDEVFEEVETEDEEEIVDDDDAPDADNELSIGERLHRGMAKNMRSAFSINDSIRFRRELFGNSQAEYNDALDMVQSMHSFAEAEEYFYDDLEWDPTNEEVKDFMEVVRRHFL